MQIVAAPRPKSHPSHLMVFRKSLRYAHLFARPIDARARHRTIDEHASRKSESQQADGTDSAGIASDMKYATTQISRGIRAMDQEDIESQTPGSINYSNAARLKHQPHRLDHECIQTTRSEHVPERYRLDRLAL